MLIHFDPYPYESEKTPCGEEYQNDMDLSVYWEHVTCKKCLENREEFEAKHRTRAIYDYYNTNKDE